MGAVFVYVIGDDFAGFCALGACWVCVGGISVGRFFCLGDLSGDFFVGLKFGRQAPWFFLGHYCDGDYWWGDCSVFGRLDRGSLGFTNGDGHFVHQFGLYFQYRFLGETDYSKQTNSIV